MRLRHHTTLNFVAAVFTAAIFVSAPNLSAQDVSNDQSRPVEPAAETTRVAGAVTALTVRGLKRTKTIVLELKLGRYIGRSAREIDLDEVEAAIVEMGIFDDIEATIDASDPSRPTLSLSVEEKISIVPLPIFAYTSDGLVGGFGLIDANAFGLNDKALAVGLYQSTGWMGILTYTKTTSDRAPFGWTASLVGGVAETVVEDDRERELFSYDAAAADVAYTLRRNLGRAIALEAGFGFRERAIDGRAVSSARVVPVSIGLSARGSTWDGVFLSERSAEAKGGYAFGLVGDGFAWTEGRLGYERPFYPGLRAVLRAGAFSAPSAPLVLAEGPATAAVSLLPTDFRVESLAGFSAGLEARVFGFRAATVSALAAYQIAAADGTLTGNTFAQGVALGVRLYLSKIAIPAVDIGAAFNAETGIWRGAFGIGMRF